MKKVISILGLPILLFSVILISGNIYNPSESYAAESYAVNAEENCRDTKAEENRRCCSSKAEAKKECENKKAKAACNSATNKKCCDSRKAQVGCTSAKATPGECTRRPAGINRQPEE